MSLCLSFALNKLILIVVIFLFFRMSSWYFIRWDPIWWWVGNFSLWEPEEIPFCVPICTSEASLGEVWKWYLPHGCHIPNHQICIAIIFHMCTNWISIKQLPKDDRIIELHARLVQYKQSICISTLHLPDIYCCSTVTWW